jgi:hypothetical protein
LRLEVSAAVSTDELPTDITDVTDITVFVQHAIAENASPAHSRAHTSTAELHSITTQDCGLHHKKKLLEGQQ